MVNAHRQTDTRRRTLQIISRFAPARSKTRVAPTCPRPTAHINAVMPCCEQMRTMKCETGKMTRKNQKFGYAIIKDMRRAATLLGTVRLTKVPPMSVTHPILRIDRRPRLHQCVHGGGARVHHLTIAINLPRRKRRFGTCHHQRSYSTLTPQTSEKDDR